MRDVNQETAGAIVGQTKNVGTIIPKVLCATSGSTGSCTAAGTINANKAGRGNDTLGLRDCRGEK
jgi:hypothetical protein